jgi:hypothetical protein
VLDPSTEMRSYRAALSNKKKGGDEKAARRLSAGNHAGSVQKSKRRVGSGAESRKKSPKKGKTDIRRRRRSDEVKNVGSDSDEAAVVGRRLSDMSVHDGDSDENHEGQAKGDRSIFRTNALNDVKDQIQQAQSKKEKERLLRALHKQIDDLMDLE